MSDEEFLEISGVGQRKLEVYGTAFINEVIAFTKEKKVTKNKSDTHKITYELYRKGLSIDEIAEKRKLTSTTIFSHIAKLYNDELRGLPILTPKLKKKISLSHLFSRVTKNWTKAVRTL